MKKFPEQIQINKQTENELVLTFHIDVDLFWFQGHFDKYPILPGVTQIDWVIRMVECYFNVKVSFEGMVRVKFQNPIIPNETIQLAITYDEATSNIVFYYRNGELIKSQGRLKVASQ